MDWWQEHRVVIEHLAEVEDEAIDALTYAANNGEPLDEPCYSALELTSSDQFLLLMRQAIHSAPDGLAEPLREWNNNHFSMLTACFDQDTGAVFDHMIFSENYRQLIAQVFGVTT